MTSVTRRRRSKGPDTREGVEDAIAAAMGRLLARGGSFTSVSVEELAEEAGIARSTFYMHFRDKAELVRRLMKRITRELLEVTDAWFESPDAARPEALLTALRGIAQVYLKHQALMLAITETAAYDPDVAAMFQDTMGRLAAGMRAVLKRAQRAGLADPHITPEAADALTWMVERCCNQLLITHKPAQRERLLQALAHIIGAALFSGKAA